MIIEDYDKIDIARILMERIDGVVAQARVSTLPLANAVLERWASDAPEKGEGQCQIQIIFEDGFQYQGHIGLKRSQKRISLSRLVRKQLIAMATPRLTRGRTKDGIGNQLCVPELALPLSAEAMLEKYDI